VRASEGKLRGSGSPARVRAAPRLQTAATSPCCALPPAAAKPPSSASSSSSLSSSVLPAPPTARDLPSPKATRPCGARPCIRPKSRRKGTVRWFPRRSEYRFHYCCLERFRMMKTKNEKSTICAFANVFDVAQKKRRQTRFQRTTFMIDKSSAISIIQWSAQIACIAIARLSAQEATILCRAPRVGDHSARALGDRVRADARTHRRRRFAVAEAG
jgi:hypothetical protein